VVLLRTALGFN